MSLGDTYPFMEEGESCIVCDKNVDRDSGVVHLKHEGEMVSVCCPLCMEALKKEPQRFAEKARVRRIMRDEDQH